MKDHEINKAIAESLGWRLCEKQVEGMNNVYWLPPGQEDYPEAVFIFCDTIPAEYCHDLNAMHWVEKQLNQEQAHAYANLIRRTNISGRDGSCLYERILMTPARLRAEAYLRTIGKWRDA